MTRLITDTLVLFKIQDAKGSPATPDPATDAILVRNFQPPEDNDQMVDRNILRTFHGAQRQLRNPGERTCSFDVGWVGAGTVAAAPTFASLLLASACAQTLTSTVRADYTPITDAPKYGTLVYYDAGVKKTMTDCMVNPVLKAMVGTVPVLSFAVTGLNAGQEAANTPSHTLVDVVEQLITDINTQDLTFGATHSATLTPAFSGGTVYPSTGIEFDLGTEVVFSRFLGGNSIKKTGRRARGKVEIKVTAAEEVTWRAAVDAGTTSSIGLLHGTVEGRRCGLWIPAAEFSNPRNGERDGERVLMMDFAALALTANTDFRLIFSF